MGGLGLAGNLSTFLEKVFYGAFYSDHIIVIVASDFLGIALNGLLFFGALLYKSSFLRVYKAFITFVMGVLVLLGFAIMKQLLTGSGQYLPVVASVTVVALCILGYIR